MTRSALGRLALLTFVLSLLTVAGLTSLQGRELSANCELYGAVQVRNQQAPVGTHIEAYISGILMADTTVRVRGHYEIAIPSDDPVTLDHDGWLENDVITLVVDGESAQPNVTAFDGRQQVDIAVQFISDVRKSTWGKIKALFR